MYGWVGNILRVDLSSGKISAVPTSEYVPRFVGGWGIMAKIAWDELTPDTGAFDPENRIMVMTGPERSCGPEFFFKEVPWDRLRK